MMISRELGVEQRYIWPDKRLQKQLRPSAELTGYLYPSAEEAKTAVVEKVDKSDKSIFFDLDDTTFHSEPFLRAQLNAYFADRITGFEPVTLQEVLAAGGRYFNVPRYQEAAQTLKKPFKAIWQTVAEHPLAHAKMVPWKGALHLYQAVLDKGYTVVGYPTARPQSMASISARSLKTYRLPMAPIVDVMAQSADPSIAKLGFFQDVLQALSQEKIAMLELQPIVLVDDHVKTALLIHEVLGQYVRVLVPQVPRNQNEAAILGQAGIPYGYHDELAELL